jgi:Ser/Thr protein kinase RdoA (MazF antagonist)
MTEHFPVTNSILSAQALIARVLPDYDIQPVTKCVFLSPGLNDTYLVNTQDSKYILRVYRIGWRSLTDILYELEALLHLKHKGISVSVPIPKKDGNLVSTVMAPEGLRYIVLFTYAPGKEPSYESEEENKSYIYGKITAKIHTATEDFNSSHPRFSIDLEHLLDKPLRLIRPFLSHRPSDWDYLVALAENMREQVYRSPIGNLEMGFCHGDFHGWNAHLDQDDLLTFFDFDCCGLGWRAYDIAVFHWSARLRGKDKERWPSFLRGYTEERPLSDIDIQAIPYFVAIRHIWLLGLHADPGPDRGVAYMDDEYFDRGLKFLREWEKEYL